MTENELTAEIERVKGTYEKVEWSSEASGETLIRIREATLPKGCVPGRTRVLVRITPGQARPEVFVEPGIKVPNGKEPRSTSVVLVGGESWLQFSYTFPWDERENTVEQFISSSLQRFAKSE